jgi:glycosyltransferase involved in cell wall biosynthesis
MLVGNETILLENFLNQYSDYFQEIVIGCTNGSSRIEQILPRYNTLKNIKFISVSLEDGFSVARNEAIQHLNTEWILQMDPDEIISPKFFIEVIPLLCNKEILSYCIPIVNLLRDDSTVISHSLRLYRNQEEIKYRRRCHESVSFSIREIKGNVGKLSSEIIHYGFLVEEEERKKKLDFYWDLIWKDIKEGIQLQEAFSDISKYYFSSKKKIQGVEILETSNKIKKNYYIKKNLYFQHLLRAKELAEELVEMESQEDVLENPKEIKGIKGLSSIIETLVSEIPLEVECSNLSLTDEQIDLLVDKSIWKFSDKE